MHSSPRGDRMPLRPLRQAGQTLPPGAPGGGTPTAAGPPALGPRPFCKSHVCLPDARRAGGPPEQPFFFCSFHKISILPPGASFACKPQAPAFQRSRRQSGLISLLITRGARRPVEGVARPRGPPAGGGGGGSERKSGRPAWRGRLDGPKRTRVWPPLAPSRTCPADFQGRGAFKSLSKRPPGGGNRGSRGGRGHTGRKAGNFPPPAALPSAPRRLIIHFRELFSRVHFFSDAQDGHIPEGRTGFAARSPSPVRHRPLPLPGVPLRHQRGPPGSTRASGSCSQGWTEMAQGAGAGPPGDREPRTWARARQQSRTFHAPPKPRAHF